MPSLSPGLPPELPGGGQAQSSFARGSQETHHRLRVKQSQVLTGRPHERQTDRHLPCFPPAFSPSGFAPSSALAVFQVGGSPHPSLSHSPSHHLPPWAHQEPSLLRPHHLRVKQANPRPSSAQTAGNEHTASSDAWPNPVKTVYWLSIAINNKKNPPNHKRLLVLKGAQGKNGDGEKDPQARAQHEERPSHGQSSSSLGLPHSQPSPDTEPWPGGPILSAASQ